MNRNSDKIVVIINDVNKSNAAKISRIPFSNMFGDKELPGKHLVIYNQTDCPIGQYPKAFYVKGGFSNDFGHAAKTRISEGMISEIIINGNELYCFLEKDNVEEKEEYISFEEAINNCLN